MKNFSRGLEKFSQWCITACLLCLTGHADGATLSVSPSTISDTCIGSVTLSVSNLNPGDWTSATGMGGATYRNSDSLTDDELISVALPLVAGRDARILAVQAGDRATEIHSFVTAEVTRLGFLSAFPLSPFTT